MILLGILAILTLGLTIGSFALRQSVLAIAAGACWIMMAVASYGLSTALWDVYYALFFVGAFMTIVCVFEAVYMRPKKEVEEEEILSPEDRSHKEFMQQWKNTSVRPLGVRPRRRGLR